MPQVQWEWKLTPQILVSLANFLLMAVGVVGIFVKMQADIQTARDAVGKLEILIATMREGQTTMVERVTKVETKVDIMLPAIQRIETNMGRPGR